MKLKFSQLYGPDHDGRWTRYLTRIIIGPYMLHRFDRGDADPDPHDHPWDFWTFPLTSYVEETTDPSTMQKRRNIVPAFQWSFRPAEYTHRVLGRFDRHATSKALADDVLLPGNSVSDCFRFNDKPIWTIVKREGRRRQWGFLKTRDGKTCWTFWDDYVNNGGRNTDCE